MEEELSIEEKAKRYDEAIKIAKDCQYDGLALSQPVKDVIEHIFPELKEEERIKSCIKKCLSNAGEQVFDDYNVRLGDCLAWIEKQGEPNPYSGTSFEYNGHTWGMCARDGGVEISYDRNLKAFLSSEKSFIYDHSQESTAPESVMEAVKEENVSNGNKLKFKIGDWIVNPKGEALHITDIKDSCYIFNDDESHYWLTCYCDQKCHLWTIEDAKDGDILCSERDSIIIFAGVYGAFCKYYVALTTTTDSKLIINENKEAHLWGSSNVACLATKEQQDFLFQKMTEKGYRWDSENKKVELLPQKKPKKKQSSSSLKKK